MAEVKEIPVEKIKVGEHALRMEAEDETLDELAESIRRIGIIVPLAVVSSGGVYMLVAGHRRLLAAKKCGLQKVPCIVRDDDKAQAKEVSFAENLFRTDLSPVELAAGIKDIFDQGIMELPALAAAMHRSPHWVGAQLLILNWPIDVQQAIHEGWLSVSAASNLALVNDDTYREFLLRNAEESGATARTTAAWLQAWRSMQPPEEAIRAEPVDGQKPVTPAVPQAPCICCGEVYRADELSHVPVCVHCIKIIREVGHTR